MSAEITVQELFKKCPNGSEALKGVGLEIQKGQFFTSWSQWCRKMMFLITSVASVIFALSSAEKIKV